jgi:hypothetical protein
MTDLPPHRESPQTPQLVLTLRNERPILAADLGKLFTALASDYRRLNRGRTLVVTELHTGTILAHLQEALDAIAPYAKTGLDLLKAAKNLKQFAEILRGFIGKAKDHPEEGDLFQKKPSRRSNISRESSFYQPVSFTAGRNMDATWFCK